MCATCLEWYASDFGPPPTSSFEYLDNLQPQANFDDELYFWLFVICAGHWSLVVIASRSISVSAAISSASYSSPLVYSHCFSFHTTALINFLDRILSAQRKLYSMQLARYSGGSIMGFKGRRMYGASWRSSRMTVFESLGSPAGWMNAEMLINSFVLVQMFSPC